VTGGRVQYWPSGAVSYLLRYRFKTKSKKLVIGKFNPDANELAEVRKKAREAQNQLIEARRGGDDALDPVAAHKAAREAARANRDKQQAAGRPARDLVERVVEDFMILYAKPHTKDWRETERLRRL